LGPEAATGGCVNTGTVTGSCVGPTGSKRMLSGSQWQLSKSGWAPLAVTGSWVKPSGLNTTLYGPQAVIGGCVGP